jgi:hypothetical protein
MNFEYPSRAKVALTLVLALILVSDIYFALTRKIFDTTIVPNEEVSLYQKRFETLRPIQPRRGLVGYIGDTEDVFGDRSSMKAYYMTQYTLSPLVIANSTALPLVIGNFNNLYSDRPLPNSKGLVLIIDVGDGVQFFRRREG